MASLQELVPEVRDFLFSKPVKMFIGGQWMRWMDPPFRLMIREMDRSWRLWLKERLLT